MMERGKMQEGLGGLRSMSMRPVVLEVGEGLEGSGEHEMVVR